MRAGFWVILIAATMPLFCAGATKDRMEGRFRVSVEIAGSRSSFAATLKDAWGSYLAFREGTNRERAIFENVPSGDFSLRVEFPDGGYIWRSLRVDLVHASKKKEISVSLKPTEATSTPDSLESAHSVSTEDLAISKQAQSTFRKAWSAMELGDWQGAQALLEKAVEIAPGYFDAWNNAGVVARKQENIDAAERCFRRALLLRPDSYEVNINLAEVMADRKQLDAAIQYARRAYRQRPNDPLANAQLGMHLFHANRFEECIPHLRLVAERDPKSYYYPQILLATAYERLNDPFHALEQIDHWLKHHQTNPDRTVVAAKKQELEQRVSTLEDVSAQ